MTTMMLMQPLNIPAAPRPAKFDVSILEGFGSQNRLTNCSSHDKSDRIRGRTANGGLRMWSVDEDMKGVGKSYTDFKQHDGAKEEPFTGVKGVQPAIDELEGTESK